MKDFSTLDLTCHIAVSAGEVCLAVLGGVGEVWSAAVNGPCLSDLSSCIDDARSQELVISNPAYSLAKKAFDSSLEIQELPSGNVRVLGILSDADSADDDVCFIDRFVGSKKGQLPLSSLLKFLPMPVLASLRADSFQSIGELREVTTMFVKLDTFSFEEHRDLSTLQPYVSSVQEALARTGGYLRQFIVDDKGCVIIGLWGVPTASFTNNATRALHCAVNIILRAGPMGHRCSIGITSGKAFCGTIGSILRRDYVAIGDDVNMAARLMGKAHGSILVSADLHQDLSPEVQRHMHEVAPLKLKGKDEPVITFAFNEDVLPSHLEARGSDFDVTALERLFPVDSFVLAAISDVDVATGETEYGADIVFVGNENKLGPISKANRKDGDLEAVLARECTSNLSENIRSAITAMATNLKVRADALNPSMPPSEPANMTVSYCSRDFASQPAGSPPPQIQVAIVRGAQGMGKTETARFFSTVMTKHKFRVYTVVCTEDMSKTAYSMIRALFLAVVGEFETEADQRRVLIDLLRRTYDNLSFNTVLKTKFPMLKKILNLQWDLSADDKRLMAKLPSVDTCVREAARKRVLSLIYGGSSATSMAQIDMTLYDVFFTLLRDFPFAIVAENTHHADKQSWNELLLLADLKVWGALLVTTQEELRVPAEFHTAIAKHMKKSTCFLTKYGSLVRTLLASESEDKEESFYKTADVGISQITKIVKTFNLNNVIELPLKHLDAGQVKNILSSVTKLKDSDIPGDVVSLVHRVSGGNPFWCRLFAFFIADEGRESFLRSITILDDSAPASRSSGSGTTAASVYQQGRGSVSDKTTENYESSVDRISYTSSSESIDFLKYSKHLKHFILYLVDKLSAQERLVLRFMSIWGLEPISTADLMSLIPKSFRDSVDDVLHKLLNRRLLSFKPSNLTWRFNNSFMREIIYDTIPPR
jgi:class 3 adenylate cyclase